MPYVKYCDREKYSLLINTAQVKLKDATAGEINYVLSSMIWNMFDENRNYAKANELMGVLECVKQEFYRRKVALYEDEKMIENGDICVD